MAGTGGRSSSVSDQVAGPDHGPRAGAHIPAGAALILSAGKVISPIPDSDRDLCHHARSRCVIRAGLTCGAPDLRRHGHGPAAPARGSFLGLCGRRL